MKKLNTILENIGVIEICGETNIDVSGIAFLMNEVISSCVFVAITHPRTKKHGFEYLDRVMAIGSRVVVSESFPETKMPNMTYIKVEDSFKAMAMLAVNFYDRPSEKIKVIVVTGTNGKTSIVTMLHELFRNEGYNVGLLSTICNKINDETYPTNLTTPTAIHINRLLKLMVDANCKYCFMEATSIGIQMQRIYGLKFTGAVYTNLSVDHLDFHKTYKSYKLTKKILFDNLPPTAFVVANYDDKETEVMLQDTKATKYSVSLKTENCDFPAKIIQNSISGLLLELEGEKINFGVRGAFNGYNLTTAYAVACCLQPQDRKMHLEMLKKTSTVKGRFQVVDVPSCGMVIIDFAHTPQALEDILTSVNAMKKSKDCKVIVVFGCGGNRDREKRPVMGKIGIELSDVAIVTSDNPRNEDPEKIISEVISDLDPKKMRIFPGQEKRTEMGKIGVELSDVAIVTSDNPRDEDPTKIITDVIGELDSLQMKSVRVIVDRKQAIATGIKLMDKDDILVIAGRGHETHQIVDGRKIEFSDYKVVKDIFNGNKL